MAAADEDVSAAFGAEPDPNLRRHPIALFFHVVFRVGALLTYLFCTIFSSSFITNFIVVVLLSAFDFWTVKNVTGRLLVGLRWWNKVDEDGQNQWIFESRKDGRQPLPSEKRIFWTALVVTPLVWVLFVISSIFRLSFNYLMAASVGLGFTGSNLYGYYRCSQGNTDISTAARQFIGRKVLEEAIGSQTAQSSSTPA